MLVFIGLLAGLIGMFIPLITDQGKNLALLDFDQLERNIDN